MCGYRAKYPDLIKLISESSPACICLQETMLGDSNPMPPAGYTIIKDSDPVATPGHGIAIMIESRYSFNNINLNTDLQAIAIQIHLNRLTTICNIYISPSANVEPRSLEALIDQLPEPYIILGDLNAKHQLWGERESDSRGRMIADWIVHSNVTTLNDGSPTHFHIQNNTFHAVDLSLASPSLYPTLHWSVLEDLYGSDHFPIHIETETDPPQRQRRYNISRANWEQYRAEEYNAGEMGELSLQDRYENWERHVIGAADQHIPKTNPLVKRPVPWWTPECDRLRRERKSALRRFKRTGLMVDRILYKRARAKAQYFMTKIKKESWRKYISTITVDTPMSKVWQRVRKLSRKYTVTHPPCLKVGMGTVSDPREVCEVMALYYARISSNESYSEDFNRERPNLERELNFESYLTEDYNSPIQMKEVKMVLSEVQDSAPGADLITYSMVKNLHDTALSELHKMMAELWKRGEFIPKWRKSIVLSFLKPGKDPTEKSSYRPVSLTSTVCKIMEKIVNTRLIRTLNSKQFVNSNQFGYRTGRSTVDNLVKLQTDILEAFDRKEQLVAIFFDLEKAFDTTWRYGILRILHQLDIRGPLAKFVQNFLKERKFVSCIGTQMSAEYDQEQGVPQGSVLSCTLFLMAINEILSDLPNLVTGLLYVDDLVIYTASRYLPAIERRLQTAVNKLEGWTLSHGFKFSIRKTVVVQFHRKYGPQREPSIKLYGEEIKCEKLVKYLGLVFDQRLRWTEHIKRLKTRTSKALDILKSVSGTKWGGDRITLLRLYRSLIRSKLDYACFIYWTASESELKTLDPVHNAALRIVTGAFRTSPLESLYAESGEPSLHYRRKQLALQYYLRLMQEPGSTVGDAVLGEAEHSPTAFGQRMKTITEEYGMRDVSILETELPEDPVWMLPPITCTDFKPPKKTEGNSLLMKQLFYQHIYEHHRFSNHIYTDGSKTDEGAGCAVLHRETLYSKKLTKITGIYDAELTALLKAVRLARADSQANHTVIFTDSLSVKNSMESRSTQHPLIDKILRILLEMERRGKRVTVCWVPAHIGIPQNERADEGARTAAEADTIIRNNRVHYKNYYPVIRGEVRGEWARSWRGIANNKLRTIKDDVSEWSSSLQKNRRQEVVLCRLRIGHTRLTHGWLLEGGQPPRCPHCNSRLTVKHVLAECDSYAQTRLRIYPQTANMDQNNILNYLLGERENFEMNLLMNFLEEVGLSRTI